MKKGKKGDKKSGNKPSKLIIIILLIISLILLISIISILILFFKPLNLNKTSFNVSNEINSTFLSNDLSYLYIKFNKNVSENLDISNVKILLISSNGSSYIYDTNMTYSMIVSQNLSYPLNKGIFDSLSSPKKTDYNIIIPKSGIENLSSFKEISQIRVIFESKSVNLTQNSSTSKTTRRRATITSSDESTTTTNPAASTTPSTTTPTANCTVSAWQNEDYRCTSEREQRQTRTTCPSRETEERWISAPCSSGFYCYDGANSPEEKCVNETYYCIDSDNGINSTQFGYLNISNAIFNDSCINNKNLTEYFCNYNGTEFIADNNTITCTYDCQDGACAVCNDSDGDGYSPAGGLCGLIDCNDSNSNVNPSKEEICGNDIDENCDNIASSCINFRLVSHYNFENNLDDIFNGNNASCTSCPIFNSTSGVNNSGTYEFSGINNLLYLPPQVLNNKTFSISMWVNPRPDNTEASLFYANAGSLTRGTLNIQYSRASNSVSIYNNYGLNEGTSQDSIAPNEYTNVIFTYDSINKQARLYLNGELKITDSDFSQTPDSTNIIIGAKIDQNFFKGTIDELVIYSRALNITEVQQIYNSQSAQLPSLSLFNTGTDNTLIFIGIVILIILIIIFVLFYLLMRIHHSE